MLWRTRLLVLLAGCVFAGCILPPDADEAREGVTYLPSQELSLVTHLQRGSDFALGGRTDLAELEYRRAIGLRPDLATPYNDLGFVLLQQERFDDAAAVLRKALRIAPKHVPALENLGRALYRKGEVEESIDSFRRAIEVLNGSPPDEIKEITGTTFNNNDIASIHRNLAIALFAAGILDEAICESRSALNLANNLDQAGQHGRMLLALGRLPQALRFYADTVTVWQTAVPPKMLFDYGAALYAHGDLKLAKETFGKVLEARSADIEDRTATHLVKLLIAMREKSGIEAKTTYESLLEEEPKLCTRLSVDPNRYWPYQLVDDARGLLKVVCDEEGRAIAAEDLVVTESARQAAGEPFAGAPNSIAEHKSGAVDGIAEHGIRTSTDLFRENESSQATDV